jgi:hypothetical protein
VIDPMGLVTDQLEIAGVSEEEELPPGTPSGHHWKWWQGWWWTRRDAETHEELLEPVVNS